MQHTQRADKDEPSITGTPHTIVELQAPAPGSSVLSQAQLLIDLTSDYDARFVVNGVLIPDDQLQKRPELNQVLFTPGPGKVVEKYNAGPNCVDADTNQKVWYKVVAVDRDTNGVQREGAATPVLQVDPANSEPAKPGGTGIDNTTPWSIKWTGAKYGQPPPADYTDFYYIYRDDMSGRGDRYDSIDNDGSGSTITWTDPDPGNVAHDYWVVAVDNHLAESNPAPDYPIKGRVHCDVNGACVVQ